MNVGKKLKSPYRAKKQQLSDYIRGQVASAETLEEILRVMHTVTSENVEVFNTLKGKLRLSFSKWKYSEVQKRFNLPFSLPTWEPGQCRVPQFITNFTLQAYEIVRGSHGAINKGKEIRRNLYIQMLLSSIVYAFKEKIRIEDEGALESSVSGGFVEFVVYILNEAVGFLVESKPGAVADGIAQLFLELHAASQMNSIAGLNIPSLRGAVSTAEMWTFFEYTSTFQATSLNLEESDKDSDDSDGEDEVDAADFTFKESKVFVGVSTENIVEVSGIVYWMLLQGWCDVQKQYFEVWTKALEEEMQKDKKKTRKIRKIEAIQAAAKKRFENAKQVLVAALAATTDAEACTALQLLVGTFEDKSFYP